MTDAFDWHALEATAPELLPYLRSCQEGRLVVPQCTRCQRHQWPPRPLCKQCGGDSFAWAEVPGVATLYSWMTAFRAPSPELADDVPYTVGVVTLSLPGQVRMTGRIGGVAAEPAELFAGQKLAVSYEAARDGCPIAVWTPIPDPKDGEAG